MISEEIDNAHLNALILIAGIPADVEELGASEFNGVEVGRTFGKMLAMIESLGESVVTLSEAAQAANYEIVKLKAELEKLNMAAVMPIDNQTIIRARADK
jgi:hypothetical protein